ncbi:response regulator transcription factor [Longirhabdus pacifica]|uniref:response regulator transcription factor n=1 Tax=Longirhabdus pacifica TaxID=2305227 RepID=UPI00100896D9|nr:response regulator transcription factor [Longirhabdus pacifica]
MHKICIIEDDVKIASMLKAHIEKYDYEVHVVQDFKHIKEEVERVAPHLILLDIHLPHYDGFYWCRQLRSITNNPIMYISARSSEMDQVMAVEYGGDDYITKPFHFEVVMAKIKSLLRRSFGQYATSTTSDTLSYRGLILSDGRNECQWNERKVSLTQNEKRLLKAFIQHQGDVISREALLEVLWDEIDFVDDNTLTVNVTRVRKKLQDLGIEHAIETVRGHGYRLVNWEDGS